MRVRRFLDKWFSVIALGIVLVCAVAVSASYWARPLPRHVTKATVIVCRTTDPAGVTKCWSAPAFARVVAHELEQGEKLP